ncbi:MAG: signal peptidase I [Candidatus Dormibacteraeota bacterium]|jgi:signal peptidase|nr:signal peptidase I [Candidatus Dormibacteraeota bacterium]
MTDRVSVNVGPTKRQSHGVAGRFFNALATLLTVLVVLLLAVAIFLAVTVKNGPYGERVVFGHPAFSVASGSMAPTFVPGDLIYDRTVTLAQASHLRKGQIITFVDPARTAGQAPLVITHRIYSVGTGPGPGGLTQVEYRTKGDANNVPDALPVAAADVLGVYQGSIPLGGYVLTAVHQPVTFVILIMIPVLYFVTGETRRRWRAIDAEERAAREKEADSMGRPW